MICNLYASNHSKNGKIHQFHIRGSGWIPTSFRPENMSRKPIGSSQMILFWIVFMSVIKFLATTHPATAYVGAVGWVRPVDCRDFFWGGVLFFLLIWDWRADKRVSHRRGLKSQKATRCRLSLGIIFFPGSFLPVVSSFPGSSFSLS